MDPFNVTPTEFALEPGQEVALSVDYLPLELGEHRASFVLVCDNCQVRPRYPPPRRCLQAKA